MKISIPHVWQKAVLTDPALEGCLFVLATDLHSSASMHKQTIQAQPVFDPTQDEQLDPDRKEVS